MLFLLFLFMLFVFMPVLAPLWILFLVIFLLRDVTSTKNNDSSKKTINWAFIVFGIAIGMMFPPLMPIVIIMVALHLIRAATQEKKPEVQTQYVPVQPGYASVNDLHASLGSQNYPGSYNNSNSMYLLIGAVVVCFLFPPAIPLVLIGLFVYIMMSKSEADNAVKFAPQMGSGWSWKDQVLRSVGLGSNNNWEHRHYPDFFGSLTRGRWFGPDNHAQQQPINLGEQPNLGQYSLGQQNHGYGQPNLGQYSLGQQNHGYGQPNLGRAYGPFERPNFTGRWRHVAGPIDQCD